ncbi:hypothetical protein NLI96_g7485 [Meripilus lineatus]|uniref:Uncharacterized protein n=1 Tax=Meripilus lineatus TaxID=2056292 RepID=A0AAD5UZ33_9APHY|nr:hypothetical protein NLI96_g7485 [Physisporinus lineatus]
MCIVVANILAILVSGLYAHELDTGDRKKAMGYAASIQLLGSIWGVFALSIKSLHRIPSVMIMSLLQGLGGGGIVLNAAAFVLAADTSPTSWRSFDFAIILVVCEVFLFLPAKIVTTALTSLLVAQACWIIYLSYLALFLREVPRPTVISIGRSEDAGENDSHSETSETRAVSWTVPSMWKAAAEPAKLFFFDGTQTLVWIGVVVFAMPMAEHLFWHYADRSSSKYNEDFGYYYVFFVFTLIERGVSLLLILPISVVLYRYFRRVRRAPSLVGCAVSRPQTPTERTPLLSETGQSTSTEASSSTELSPTEYPVPLSISQDLFIARCFFVVIILGSLVMFQSTTSYILLDGYLIYSWGPPFRACILSLASQASDRSQQGRVLTMLVILDSLGLATLTPYYLSVVLGRFSDFIGEASDQIGLACIWAFVICGGIISILRPARFIDVDVVLPSTVALMDVEFVEAEDPTSRDA